MAFQTSSLGHPQFEPPSTPILRQWLVTSKKHTTQQCPICRPQLRNASNPMKRNILTKQWFLVYRSCKLILWHVMTIYMSTITFFYLVINRFLLNTGSITDIQQPARIKDGIINGWLVSKTMTRKLQDLLEQWALVHNSVVCRRATMNKLLRNAGLVINRASTQTAYSSHVCPDSCGVGVSPEPQTYLVNLMPKT